MLYAGDRQGYGMSLLKSIGLLLQIHVLIILVMPLGMFFPCAIQKKDGSGGCNNSKGKTDPLKWLYRWLPKKKADEVLKHIEAYFEWVKQQSND